MIDQLIQAWQWYFKIEWAEAGGSSFVELITGLNIALLGWDQFRNRVRKPRQRCEEIISSTLTSVTDANLQSKLTNLFRRTSRPVVGIMKFMWWVTTLLAFIFSFFGIYMVYANRYCCHDWLLALPISLYVIFTLLMLGVFTVFAQVVVWACNMNTNKDDLSNDVNLMVTRAQEAQKPNSATTNPKTPGTTRKIKSGNRSKCESCGKQVTKVATQCLHCHKVFIQA